MSGANPQPFDSDNVLMTGDWVRWRIPPEVNALQFQNRSDVATNYAFNPEGANHMTLRSKYAQVMGSFNTNRQYIWFKAAAASVVEILKVNLP